MVILTCDPSLTAYGFSVVEFDEETKETKILYVSCIESKALDLVKNPKTTKTQWDIERALTIATSLSWACTQFDVDLILFENSVGSKSSVAVAALSLVKGITLGISGALRIPCEYATARSIKKYIGGSSTTTKTDVMLKVGVKLPEFITLTATLSKAKKEAISDSLAVFLSHHNL